MGNNFIGTIGQDIAIPQEPAIGFVTRHGKSHVTVVGSNNTFTFPISGIFGFQNTWTVGDTIDMTRTNGTVGVNNSITATFDFSTDLFTTTIGVQNITVSIVPFLFSTTPSTVYLEAGFTTNRLGNVVPNFEGLTNLTMQNSAAGSELFLGTPINPLEIALPTINVINVPGWNPFVLGFPVEPSGIAVIQDTSLFSATTAVTVNVTSAGSPATVSASFSDDFVHGVAETFFISIGDPGGTTGPATWNLHATGNNFLFLSNGGPFFDEPGPSTAATTINVTGSGHTTLFGWESQFADVTKISGTATLTVTGALQKDGSFNEEGGLLGDNTVITSISGGAGSWFDLSSLDATEAQAMTTINGGGGGTAVFSNEALTGLSAALNLSGISIIGDGGDFGVGPDPAGTINFAFLPGATELKFYHGLLESSSGLVLNNTPGTFTIDYQDEDYHGNAVTITPASAATSNTLTLDLGSTITGDTTHGLYGAFTITNYDSITINVREGTFFHFTDAGFPEIGTSDPEVFATEGFSASPVSGGGITLTLQGTGDIEFGNVFSVSYFGSSPVGTASIFTNGGAIVDNDKGIVAIGITDASSINASGGGGLDMQDPGSLVALNFSVTGSSGSTVHNLLQGTVGPLGIENDNGGFENTIFSPNTTIVGGHDAGDVIFTTGGATTVTLNNSGGDTIEIAQFTLNSEVDLESDPAVPGVFVKVGGTGDCIAFTDNFGDFNPGMKVATINNFSVSGDIFTINNDSWGFGGPNGFGGTYEGLVNGGLTQLAAVADDTFAVLFNANTSGATINPDTNLVVYQENSFNGTLAQLVHALGTSGGAINFPATPGFENTYDLLFAYNNGTATNIAEIQFEGDGADTSTQFLAVTGSHNLVSLPGVTAGGLFAEYLAAHANLFFTT